MGIGAPLMQWHPHPAQRRAHDSLKWASYPEGELPLWVADMDCQAPPCALKVIDRALHHGVFGYGIEPQGFREAWVTHLDKRHQWVIDPDWIVPVAGVVPAMRMAIMAHPEITDVLTPTPIYPYFRSIPHLERRSHRPIELSRQVNACGHHLYPNPKHVSQALQFSKGPSAIFWCNPQNPGGTVYDRGFIETLCDHAAAHQSLLVSDEIWADLRLSDKPHVPLGKIAAPDQPSITLMAATKTFNVAGFACAVAIIPHPPTRARFSELQQAMPHVTPLSYQVTAACLSEGWDWHAELINALIVHRDRITQWAKTHPELRLTLGDASFLAWVETPYAHPDRALARHGVRVSGGEAFGDPCAFRLNFGCSPATLETALARIDEGLESLAQHGESHD